MKLLSLLLNRGRIYSEVTSARSHPDNTCVRSWDHGTAAPPGWGRMPLLMVMIFWTSIPWGVRAAPANDDFAAGIALTENYVRLTGTNQNATLELGEPAHPTDAGGASVWYTWTPAGSGQALVSTEGSALDTILAVYSGASLADLRLLDYHPAGTSYPFAVFHATAGVAYHICVDGHRGAEGEFSLLIRQKAAVPLVSSSFEQDEEGWMISSGTDAYAPVYRSAEGRPAGCISHTDRDPSTWYFQAPAKFLGDHSSAYGGCLRFEQMQNRVNYQFDAPDVVLEGAGLKLVLDTPYNPRTDWTIYVVGLTEAAGWHKTELDGPTPTREEFQAVLKALTALRFRGEFYFDGEDIGYLDNVELFAKPIRPVSTFETGNDYWRVVSTTDGPYDPAYLTWDGNPDGCLRQSDPDSGTWYWDAPGEFLGNQLACYDGALRFHLRTSTTMYEFDRDDVVLEGAGLKLVFDTPYNPAKSWTSYTVPLTETAGWHKDDLTGPAPSKTEFQTVLAALATLRIRGEYSVNPDTGYLDNVRLLDAASMVPELSITLINDSELQVAWPTYFLDYRLETTDKLDPPINWQPVQDQPVGDMDLNTVKLAPNAKAAFFRLKQP